MVTPTDAVSLAGSETRPSRGNHPFNPIVLNRPARAAHPALKVVAFNARGGRNLHAILERLHRPPLLGADVILLCEADWRRRRSAGLEFAAELASALGMSFAFVPEFGIGSSSTDAAASLGNAILSSQPLNDVYAVSLPVSFLRRRWRRLRGGPAGLVATAVFNRKAIVLGVSHLNSRGDPAGRDAQMRDYLAALPAAAPAIIGGDFNSTTIDVRETVPFFEVMRYALTTPRRFHFPEKWEPLFSRLAAANFEIRNANVPGKPTFTFTRMIPPFLRPKLDWIALRGVEAVPFSAAVVPARRFAWSKRFSDHDFIVCDVRI